MHAPIRKIEETYDAIFCEDTSQAIHFIDDPVNQGWRKWRRRGEVAKTVERILVENGYKDRSLDVYFMYRYYDSRADQRVVRRAFRRLLLEWLWGYGVKVMRPILAWLVVVLLFTLIYALLPAWDPSVGLSASGTPRGFLQGGMVCWQGLFDSFVFSSQVSSLSVYGDMKPVGVAKLVALIQQVMSVIIVGFGVATITRRIGNV
jgi:hypothetical protein